MVVTGHEWPKLSPHSSSQKLNEDGKSGQDRRALPLDPCTSFLLYILTSASLARTYSRNLNRYHLSFVPETFIFIFILEYYYKSTHSTVRLFEQRGSMNALNHSLSRNYALGAHLKLVPGEEPVSEFSQSNDLTGHFFFSFFCYFST